MVVKQQQNKGIEPIIGSRNSSPSFNWNHKILGYTLNGIEKISVTYYSNLVVPEAKEAIESLTYLAKELGLNKMVLLSIKGKVETCEKIVINRYRLHYCKAS